MYRQATTRTGRLDDASLPLIKLFIEYATGMGMGNAQKPTIDLCHSLFRPWSWIRPWPH